MKKEKIETRGTQEKRGPGRPRLAPETDKKKDILLAAIDAFGARGFDGVSLSQIAERASADIGLTRYYFGSKEALWRACIDHLAETLGLEMQEVLASPEETATRQLKSVIRWFISISAQWPQLSRMIVFDGDNEGSRGIHVADQLISPFYAVMSELINEAKGEGSLADVSPRTLFFMITHGGSFPMALPVLTNKFPGGDIMSEQALNAHADAIIDMIFREPGGF